MNKDIVSLILEVAGNRVLTFSSLQNKDHLFSIFGAIAEESPILRSSYLGSQESVFELYKRIEIVINCLKNETKQTVSRICFLQLNSIEYEWDLVQTESQALARAEIENNSSQQKRRFEIAHVLFPSEYPYFRHDPDATSEFTLKAIFELKRQFNAQAWLVYCRWLNNEAKSLLKEFRAEDTEEYQLQAVLEDFGHEVESPLLKELQGHIAKTIRDESKVRQDDRRLLFALEKELSASRRRLLLYLETQNSLLHVIYDAVSKVESVHPELIPFKIKTWLLKEMINDQLNEGAETGGSFGKQLLMLHLLDEQFGSIPVISCDTGGQRTQFVLCIRLAFAEMKRTHSFDELLDMTLSWDDLRTPVTTIREEFCRLILDNLIVLNQKTRKPMIENQPKWGVNCALLSFFPLTYHLSIEGKTHLVSLVIKDPDTGVILGCTEEGLRLLNQLSLL